MQCLNSENEIIFVLFLDSTTAWCHFSMKHHNLYLKHTIAIKKIRNENHLGWFWNNVLITTPKQECMFFCSANNCTTAQIIHFISTAKSSSLIEKVCAHGVGLCPSHHIAYTICISRVYFSRLLLAFFTAWSEYALQSALLWSIIFFSL